MGKRIAAWIGIGLIAVMYLLTAVAAVTARPETKGLFMASVVITILVPILMWMFIKMYEVAHKNDGISISEMRKINKRIKAGENPEEIAAEIEEKYGNKK